MRKVDEEEEQKQNHKLALAPDDPQGGTTMLPLTSRWSKHSSIAMSMEKNKVGLSPQHGTMRRIKIKIKRKRKGRIQRGKGKRKNNKQQVFNSMSSFTTPSLMSF